MRYVPFSERYGSVSDLHYQLGKLVEDRPGQSDRRDGSGRAHNTNDRCFEDIEPAPCVNFSALDRMEPHIASLRDGDPERWAELQREWNAGGNHDIR